MGEIDKLLAKAATKGHLEALESYYNEHATPEVKAIAKAGKKTIKGAYAYITSYAKTKAKDGCAMLTDDTVFTLLLYYMENLAEGAKYKRPGEKGKAKAKAQAEEEETEKPIPVNVVPQPAAPSDDQMTFDFF